MIINSIKQMLRMPIKSISFLLLLALSGMFLTLGAVLWITNHSLIHSYEDIFVTIGTVEQKAFSVKQTAIWDAEQKDYQLRQKAVYSNILPVSILSFEGTNYIKEPEKRSLYGSYAPEYILRNELNYTDLPIIIAEITPLEDCVPDESVEVKINKIYLGDSWLEGTTLWFCNHYTQNPKPLQKEKSYAVVLNRQYWTHGKHYSDIAGEGEQTFEYIPMQLSAIQYESDGTPMNNVLEVETLEPSPYYEITEDFYASKIGKILMNLVQGYNMLKVTLPVTGTNATVLLMPFYNGDAYINEGRDISEEEYESGKKVCLVSRKFAENNSLTIGSTLHLKLYYTNSKKSAGQVYHLDGGGMEQWMPIDANGETLSVFEDSQYAIVGIYDISAGASQSNYSMGGDEVIVPMKSIKNCDAYNIMEYGPMKGNTTSFQIPNGSVEEFLTAWEQYGTNELQITFYDMGYSQIKSGLENMKRMSFVLLIVGFLMVLFLLLFYSHLFITNQKERTAIERCLGVEKKKCLSSLLFGMLLILSVGSTLGCVFGGGLSHNISSKNLNKIYYDASYSSVADVKMEEQEQVEDKNTFVVIGVVISSDIFIILLGMLICTYKINQNLKLEPIKLLSERRNIL
ncbi:FtsX-like permease family protein [Konateibacter massiliensis]|uniref:FtsX-like permease family protein n=1 Tax=Konateibacter massiliensis TaxID=2002841 RepID=UPI000C15680D|nr:FtsX-like permease family protein [Konateibacter massiliensis]